MYLEKNNTVVKKSKLIEYWLSKDIKETIKLPNNNVIIKKTYYRSVNKR